MKETLQIIYMFGLYIIFPTEVWSTSCPDGQQCAESHECCPGGCCLPRPPPHLRPAYHPDYFNFSTPMKYYLWLLLSLAAFVLTLAWCCRLRQQVPHWRCWWPCRGWRSTQQRSPDTDSAGSCYYPPQYSRCGSLCRATVQPAPPPYNEVTSKPDLYPMVIYLGADKNDGDLMVQYFKNYIVRPAGSLSATSTADSLSSSFLCNTANEANTIIPPPYSCTGSMDWAGVASVPAPTQRQALLRSVSSVTCHHQPRTPDSHTASSTAIYQLAPTSPSPQISSENSQIFIDNHRPAKLTLPHSVSVPNNRLYQADVNMKTFSQESNNSNISIAEHEIAQGFSGNNKIINKNESKIDNHRNYGEHQIRSPRVQINQYYNESSNDSNDENIEANRNIYIPQNHNTSIRKIRNDESCSAYDKDHLPKDTLHNYSDDIQHNFNIHHKNRDYSFADSSLDRNISSFNLHSLEDNNFSAFYSHSIAEGATNENISSDYSNFAKNLNNFGSKEEIHRMYSVGGSMTGSDISSLANLGTPDSPPRATSPTSELKELLDKIQQLPNDTDQSQPEANDQDDINFTNDVKEMKNFFCKSRKNSLYMPLNLAPKSVFPGKVSPSSNMCFKRQFTRKSWLSRSAPTTPCGSGFVPNILNISQRSGGGSGRSSRQSKEDGSPLLTEQDVSGDEDEH